MKECLLNFSYSELENLILSLGEKRFRTGQIFRSLHLGLEFNDMTDLSKVFREKLIESYDAQPVRIIKHLQSVDGTMKFLFALRDGNVVEGVLMKYNHGYSLCISTQVGCRMRCVFCASGLNGLVRNLEAGEILGEVICVNKFLGGALGENRKIINIIIVPIIFCPESFFSYCFKTFGKI